MSHDLIKILEKNKIEASAPCRIDMGGTLDISLFYYTLRHFNPCTFNIAIDLRTKVSLYPYNENIVKITSRGFESTEYPLNDAPFNHPLGLMFAIASYFNAEGVHIVIESASPPRSSLGGSSVAAVALIAALFKAFSPDDMKFPSKQKIALLAHAIESSVAGVPCGIQDQLAACFGGVHAWHWEGCLAHPAYKKISVLNNNYFEYLEKHLLIAYCGIPHESKDVNGTWVRQFLSGKYRKIWVEIVNLTNRFIEAFSNKKFDECADAMNKETDLRREMTPGVLDNMGEKLINSATNNNCGARFTGAGGGGCIWALGEPEAIDRLRTIWKNILLTEKEACLLEPKIAKDGIIIQG